MLPLGMLLLVLIFAQVDAFYASRIERFRNMRLFMCGAIVLLACALWVGSPIEISNQLQFVEAKRLVGAELAAKLAVPSAAAMVFFFRIAPIFLGHRRSQLWYMQKLSAVANSHRLPWQTRVILKAQFLAFPLGQAYSLAQLLILIGAALFVVINAYLNAQAEGLDSFIAADLASGAIGLRMSVIGVTYQALRLYAALPGEELS